MRNKLPVALILLVILFSIILVYIVKNNPEGLPLSNNSKATLDRQTVKVSTQASADSSIEQAYEISYTPSSNRTAHTVLSEPATRLLISDESFELTIGFPVDGGATPLEFVPDSQQIESSNLGTLHRITMEEGYIYTSNIPSPCSESSDDYPVCLMNLIELDDSESIDPHSITAYCTTTSPENVAKCDNVISSLEVKQI